MKKRLLIVSDSLRPGGVQSSLKSFIANLPEDEYDIELFLFNKEGTENFTFSKNIKVSFGSPLLQTVSCTSSYAKKQGLKKYLIRKIFALLCRIFSSHRVYKFIFKSVKSIKNIDIAISYSNNVSDKSVYFGYNLFVLDKVAAGKKIAYIHADYTNIQSKYCDGEYEKFDKIWFVSNYTKQIFLKHNPSQNDKCDIIPNFIDTKKLLDVPNNPYHNDKFHIVTAGRLDKDKHQFDSVEIAKILKKHQIDFEWYLVGDGPERKNLAKLIKQNNLENNIIVTGYRNDVNAYLKFADASVSLSQKETFGLTIYESLFLDTITIARNLPVVREIVSKSSVIICKNNKDIATKIMRLCSDRKYYKKAKSRVFIDFNNADIIKAINQSIN